MESTKNRDQMNDEKLKVALQTLSQANNHFTFDLYKVLAKEPGNLFFSPISIQVILALVYLGARNKTAQEIAKGLRLPEDKDVIEDGIGAIMHHLKDSDDVMLDIANKIFLKIGFPIKNEFNQSAIKFLAGIEEVDFEQEAQARKTINDWVESKTNQKIKNIIPPGIFDEYTRLVLVNAIYFKGDWLKQFKKELTKPMPFRSSAPPKNVSMMYTEDNFMHTFLYELGSQVLLLPYKGKRLSMMIILPNEVNGLIEFDDKLTNINIPDVMTKMYQRRVKVYLPKFKLEYKKELSETLQKFGMESMFIDDVADFSGIAREPLIVSNVLHKAFVEVNEEGTEAAAATAVVMSCLLSANAGPPPPVVFKADHPFLFFIMDQRTKAVLFAGRLSAPAPAV